MLRRLEGLAFVGCDIVEVAPAYDVAEITALAGATMAWEYVCLIGRAVADGKMRFLIIESDACDGRHAHWSDNRLPSKPISPKSISARPPVSARPVSAKSSRDLPSRQNLSANAKKPATPLPFAAGKA